MLVFLVRERTLWSIEGGTMTTESVSRILTVLFTAVCCINISGQVTDPANNEHPKPTPAETTQAKIKIVFDDKRPGVVYIESNGERVRVDTAKKTFANVADVPGEAKIAPDKTDRNSTGRR
jgi:hypothetical protein